MATKQGAGGSLGLAVLFVLSLALLASELRSADQPVGGAASLMILDVVAFPR